MKIYWITKLTERDPFKTTQLGLSAALRQRGHDVTLFMAKHFSEKNKSHDDIRFLPTIEYPILSGLIYGLILFFYLPLYVRKNKVDVLFIDGSTIWSPFLISQKISKTIIIWDIRDLSTYGVDKKLKDVSLYLSRYFVDGYTTITPELSEILNKKYHLQHKKIGIWSSGVSKQCFLEFSKMKKEINLKDPSSFVLIYHGTYSPTRGVENLIRSIGELDNPLKKNITLFLIGIPQNKTRDLTSLCENLKIPEQVKIIPLVEPDQIPYYIRGSDVGIIPLPPDLEEWRVSVPLKSLEYLALGKPIIATNIPFHQKIFDMGTCGILLNSNTPKDIAEAITYLYKNKDNMKNMGQKGKEIIEKYFTWDHKAIEVESFLKHYVPTE